jgi:hypothetical protein
MGARVNARPVPGSALPRVKSLQALRAAARLLALPAPNPASAMPSADPLENRPAARATGLLP